MFIMKAPDSQFSNSGLPAGIPIQARNLPGAVRADGRGDRKVGRPAGTSPDSPAGRSPAGVSTFHVRPLPGNVFILF